MPTSPLPKGKIVVVALELNKQREAKQFDEFSKQAPEIKLQQIKDRIRSVCKELQSKEKNAMWIIGWPEYGLSGGNSRAVSSEIKKEFKKAMQELTEEYPNLVIFGGTISSMKKFNNMEAKSKLDELKTHYSDKSSIVEYVREKDNELQKAQDSVTTNPIEHHETELLEVEKHLKGNDLFVNRDTLYVIEKGKIQRHDKMAPKDETAYNPGFKNIVFQPGHGRSGDPIFSLNHPETQEKMLIATSICQELKYNIVDHASPENESLLHLIFSDFIKISEDKIPKGNFVVQFDTKSDPALIYLKSNLRDQNKIELYRNNLLAEKSNLMPVKPISRFEYLVLSLLDDAIKTLPHKKKVINTIKKSFQSKSKGIHEESDLARILSEILEKNKKELLKDPPQFSLFKKETAYGDIHKMIAAVLAENLEKLIKNTTNPTRTPQ